MRLENRFALVTGGSRGIGRAAALALAAEGANVAVNYQKAAAEAEQVVAAIQGMGRQAIALQADVRRSAAVRAAVSRVIESWGRIDILVNNAGIDRYTPFMEITEEEWDEVLDVVLKGQFLFGQEVARHMIARGYGRILNVASIAAFVPYHTHYSVAKAGVVMLTKSMAAELGRHNIVVNAIAPGSIVTDMNRHHWSVPERRAKRLAQIPMGRLGDPEDLTKTIVHLVSDETSYMTGAVIVLDGGATLGAY